MTEVKIRTFTVIGAYTTKGCKTKFRPGTKYTAKQPVQAAMKAFTRLCRVKRIRGVAAYYVVLREETSGSAQKEYSYLLHRGKLDKPLIRFAGTKKEFKIQYKNTVASKKVPKRHVKCKRMSAGPMKRKRGNLLGGQVTIPEVIDNKKETVEENYRLFPPEEVKNRLKLQDSFEIINALEGEAMGKKDYGKLVKGASYIVLEPIKVYRLWNSTNPRSRTGQWWTFTKPEGKTSDYRKNYEICYNWSPLDRLVEGTLKKGAVIVLGRGQSAKCSEYLTYPQSTYQQVYIPNPEAAVMFNKDDDSVVFQFENQIQKQ